MPLSKAEQIAEGQQRVSQGVVPKDGNPREDAIEQSPETTGPDDVVEASAPRHQEEPQERQPERPTRIDPRDEIAKRFRAERHTNEAAEDAAQLREFANQGVPPEMLAEPEQTTQQPEPRQAEEPPPLVISRPLKVRGKEIDPSTLTQDQLIDALQKGLAGDDYLNEARSKADEAASALTRVNTLLQETEQRVRAPAAVHPGSETTGTPAPGTTDPAAVHPGADAVDPRIVEAVKQLQFEEPETAARSLQTIVEGIVEAKARPVAHEALRADRRADELARNHKTLEDFKNDNPDIATDPRAVAAIKQDIATMQYEDLKALGFTDQQLPNQADQKELGRWHAHYRSEGAKVRPMSTLMETAVTGFREWHKGTPAETPAEPVQAKPRVVVKLDRTERRETIPQQPNRSVAPRPDTAQSQPRDRSSVVADMVAARQRPRQRVGV